MASECWLYAGYTDKDGYGIRGVRINGKNTSIRIHILMYEVFIGTIPKGLQLDHLCRITRCCNPAHLEPVTPRENLLRSPLTAAGINIRRTECTNGHLFNKENTYYRPAPPGKIKRTCRRCATIRNREYRKKRRIELSQVK